MDPRKILVIGCGDIGSRHLQSAASLSGSNMFEVVDPNPESLELGRRRVLELPVGAHRGSIKWLESLSQASGGGDLCIIATKADIRGDALRQAAGLGYRSFLIEKIVVPTAREYRDLMEFCAAKKLAVWVNCKTRAYSVHRKARQLVDPKEQITFTITGGNFGLATNGIHAADLFLFYDRSSRIQSMGSAIDPVLHPSKRGRGVFDLSGVLCGLSPKGSRLVISFSKDNMVPDVMTITTSRRRWIIDHSNRWAMESSLESSWQWVPVPFDKDIFISSMTKKFVEEILSSGQCELPTLAECWPSHEYILGELMPQFEALLDKPGCPVT